MTIDFLVRYLPPDPEAAGVTVWLLALELRRQGVGVRIFTSVSYAGNEGVSAGWVFPVIASWGPGEVARAMRSAPAHAADWLCVPFVPQLFNRWGISWQVPGMLRMMKKERSCKIVVVFHEFVSQWGIGPKDIILAACTRVVTKRMLSIADAAVTTCGRYRDLLKRYSTSTFPVAVIPVSANIEPARIPKEQLEERRQSLAPGNAKMIAFFNRLISSHDSDLLLQVLGAARSKGFKAYLVLLGKVEESNPPIFRRLLKAAEKLGLREYIIVTGQLPSYDISAFLQMSNVFISVWSDGISLRSSALMSALAHGMPVVGFKPVAGNYDGFDIPRSRLADRHDDRAFIEAVLQCLREEEAPPGVSRINKDYYEKNFSWPVMARKYIGALGG